MNKRIVITGMGMVSPLGIGIETNWSRLVAGASGIRAVDRFPVADLPSRIAGLVPLGHGPGELDLEGTFSAKEVRRNDLFILFALKATEEALTDAGYRAPDPGDKERTGVIIGSGIGGFGTLARGAIEFQAEGEEAVSAYFITSQLINLASGKVAVAYGFGGPNLSVVSACSTGAEAIASAARAILLDEADVVIAGGADAASHPLAIAGFTRIHALSTHFNDSPAEASRPFDSKRDGFVLGEGAGVVVVEEYEHARRRGARIHAELKGYASVSDGFHVTASHPDGIGEQRAMRLALERGGLTPADVDYLNAHATSTTIGDAGELRAIRAVFRDNDRLAISSTKGATGHTFGAAGAIEAIYSILAIERGVCPPTLNLHQPEEEFAGLNLVPLVAQRKPVRIALSNSFGFGSTKAALVFGSVEA